MSGSNKSKQKIDNIKVMKKIRKSESRRVKRIEFRHSDKVSVIFIQEWRYGQRLFCLFIVMMHRIIGLQSCLFCPKAALKVTKPPDIVILLYRYIYFSISYIIMIGSSNIELSTDLMIQIICP